MDTLETVLVILLVIDAIALGALVLLQQGKGADVGAAFGSGGANTVFGSAGSASFLTKATVWLSIAFFAISFGLAYTAKARAETVGLIGLPPIEQPAFPEASPGDVPSGDASSATDPAPEPTAEPAQSPQQDSVDDLPDV